jgi:hypothetical protein
MRWCSDGSLSDQAAQQLSDQIVAAAGDSSEESIKIFDELTNQALFHMTDEQWKQLNEDLQRSQWR